MTGPPSLSEVELNALRAIVGAIREDRPERIVEAALQALAPLGRGVFHVWTEAEGLEGVESGRAAELNALLQSDPPAVSSNEISNSVLGLDQRLLHRTDLHPRQFLSEINWIFSLNPRKVTEGCG